MKEKIDVECINRRNVDWNEYEKTHVYVADFKKRLLSEICKQLNCLHELEFSEKQWDIICGNWITNVLYAIYDRYKRVSELNDEVSFEVTKCRYKKAYSAQNLLDMFVYSDDFNGYLLAMLCEQKGIEVVYKKKSKQGIKKRIKNSDIYIYLAKGKWLLNVGKRCGLKNIANFPEIDKSCEVLLLNVRLPQRIEKEILERNSTICAMDSMKISELNRFIIGDKRIKRKKKLNLQGVVALNTYEKFCIDFLAEFFPIDYMELFRTVYNKVESCIAEVETKKVYSSAFVGVYTIPSVCAALLCGKGAKYIDIQHSAVYGVNRVFRYSELQICDEFLTWGWNDEVNFDFGNIRPCAINRIPIEYETYQFDNQSTILYTNNTVEKYDMGRGMKAGNYVSAHFRFIDALPQIMQKKLVSRLRINGDDVIYDTYRKEYEYIRVEDYRRKSFIESIKSSELLICDSYGSTHLEGMIIGVPTMFFGGIEFDLNSICEEWLNRLRDCKIYATTPEECASNLMEIKDIKSWWTEEKVQKTVQEYLSVFAYGYDDLVNCWEKEFFR